jgi:hypothetical protein
MREEAIDWDTRQKVGRMVVLGPCIGYSSMRRGGGCGEICGWRKGVVLEGLEGFVGTINDKTPE